MITSLDENGIAEQAGIALGDEVLWDTTKNFVEEHGAEILVGVLIGVISKRI